MDDVAADHAPHVELDVLHRIFLFYPQLLWQKSMSSSLTCLSLTAHLAVCEELVQAANQQAGLDQDLQNCYNDHSSLHRNPPLEVGITGDLG